MVPLHDLEFTGTPWDTTADVEKTPIKMIINRDAQGHAQGKLFKE